MKTTTTPKQEGKRREPRSASSTKEQPPAFVYDAERVAAEDKMDADWYEARRLARAKLSAEWRGKRKGAAGWIRALERLTPPQPPGYQDRLYRCNHCGLRTEHNMEFDCIFCRQCNRWIEPKCSDPGCEFCSKRPERPLPEG